MLKYLVKEEVFLIEDHFHNYQMMKVSYQKKDLPKIDVLIKDFLKMSFPKEILMVLKEEILLDNEKK